MLRRARKTLHKRRIMIKQVIFGDPFETDAVVKPVEQANKLTYWNVEDTAEKLIFRCKLSEKDIVYGLGEQVKGINKRGGRYISYNTDNPNHNDDSPSLYGSHNFIVVSGQQHFGAFFDTPGRIVWDIDAEGSGEIVITTDKNVKVVELEGDSAYAVTRDFLSIIGQSFIPPLWAFGFGQSRWGYKCRRDIDNVVEGYRTNGIPLDWVCMDIDYMDRFIDFTVNSKRFPELKAYAAALKEKGVRLVPIIDAGVKIEPGNATYDEGIAKGYFCTNHEGTPFKAAVWPGMTHFPDFFQPDCRQWFGNEYRKLTELGIEGFWNDMNEPAIFYSEYTGILNALTPAPSTELEKESNAYKDYRNFYHNVNGQRVLHEKVHNLYGALMTRAASEQLDKLLPNRFLLFSRASYIGAHRYGGIWTGDNGSDWDHLARNVRMMPSLNMCGFLYSGADTGGFGGNCSRELLLRWLAFSCFTPLMRNHTAILTRRQECYRYSGKEDFQSVVSLRYKLLPYIYSEFVKAAITSDMYIKPLGFEYFDDRSLSVQDQLLVGESIMVAPVIEKGAKGRTVWLPEEMTEVRYDGNGFVCETVPKGERKIKVALNEVVFYIRKGKCVPVCKGAQCTDELDMSDVVLIGDGKEYRCYIDDGITKEISENNIVTLRKR